MDIEDCLRDFSVTLKGMASCKETFSLHHPKFCELQSKGCLDPALAEMATLVYIDLCESHYWWDVEIEYSAAYRRPYVTGKANKHCSVSTVVPLSVHHEITFSLIESFFKIAEQRNSSIIIALCEADSTIVYYEMSDGIRPPGGTEQQWMTRIDMSTRRKHTENCIRTAWAEHRHNLEMMDTQSNDGPDVIDELQEEN